jgi:hypothetical protein
MRKWNMRLFQRDRELFGVSGFGIKIAGVS